MVLQKIKELARIEAEVLKLEAQVSLERIAELASLHESYGYDDLKSFIAALKAAGTKSKPGRKPKVARVKRSKRTRAKITDAIRAEVKASLEQGLSVSTVAKTAGISVASVNNIKKQLGLVKVRVEAEPAPTPSA